VEQVVLSSPEKPKKVVLIGAGGHATALLGTAQKVPDIKIVALLETAPDKIGQMMQGFPIDEETEEALATLITQDVNCVSLGFAGTSPDAMEKRAGTLKLYIKKGFQPVTIIDPGAHIAESADIQPGVQILPGVIVNPEARIGANVILNTGCIIEHNGQIGDNTHICPGAVVCGYTTIGAGSVIGANATLINGIHIGNRCLIGAGACVTKDLPDGTVVSAGQRV